MAKAYAIISGKGGVGKTTSAINLATSLNYLDEDSIVVDGNLKTPNVGIHLGAPVVPITLNHVLRNDAKLEDAIYEHESGTMVLPASLSLRENDKIDDKRFSDIIKKVKKIADFIFIDSAAGIGDDVGSIISASDEVIIVTNPEISAVTDALKAVKLAQQKNRPIKGFILNRHTGESHEMNVQNIIDMLEVPILGIIPEDVLIRKSQSMKNPIIYTHPKSSAARNYIKVSRKIIGENLELEEYKTPGLFRKFLRSIGFK